MTSSTELRIPASKRMIEPTLPSADGWPLVGAIPQLMGGPIDYVMAAREKYGDIYRLNLGLTKIIMLNHPRHAQHVLIDNARNYTKAGPIWDSLRTLLGNGLPVSEGDFWKRQRRMMQPHFHRRRLAAITDHMVTAIDDGLATWPGSDTSQGSFRAHSFDVQSFDMMSAMSKITMRVIVRALFGTSIAAQDMETVSAHMNLILEKLLQGVVTQKIPGWMPLPGRQRYQQAIAAIDDVVFGMIERHKANADQPVTTWDDQADEANGVGDSLVAMLLDMVDAETGEQMTPQQLRDEAVTMFLAGYETTAATLAWAFHFLTQEPQYMERLQHEIDTVLGDRTPGFGDLPQLPYARMVLQEAMRYYPPSWQLTRTTVEDDVIDGYLIPAGSEVAVMQHVIHHHPDIWSEPHRFDPGRFTPEQEQARPKQAWIPFGAGQRLCIGRDMSIMEGQLVLARVLQRYSMRAISGQTAEPHAAMTLRPKEGVWVELRRRTS